MGAVPWQYHESGTVGVAVPGCTLGRSDRGCTVAVPQCCGRPWSREVGTVGLVLWYCGSVVDRGAVVYGTVKPYSALVDHGTMQMW